MSRPLRPIPPLPVAAFAGAALLPVPLVAGGAVVGGAALWGAFLYMAVLAILIDELVPRTAGAAEGEDFPAAEVVLVGVALGAVLILPLVTWAVTQGALTGAEKVALFLTAGLWLGQVAHPAAHELIHRPRRGLFWLGVLVYVAMLFGHHASAHRLVHHRHVASPDDPNTARPGEGYYRFLIRAWRDSFIQGLRAETRLRGAGGGGPHPYAVYVGGAALALGVAFLIGGLPGGLVWAGLALHAQSQILLADYVQHYGLTRALVGPGGKREPVGVRHSWNTAHWFTSALLLNAPRHSDHHLNPARPFPALQMPDDAPRLPWPLPLACMIALVPPLWRRMIRPHLSQWRALAAAAQDTAP